MPWHTHLHSHGALSCVLFICWITGTCSQLCPYNFYSSTGSSPCTSCKEGRYTTQTGSVYTGQTSMDNYLGQLTIDQICIKCPAGKYKQFDDTTICLNCPAQTPYSIPGSNLDKCMNKDYYCNTDCQRYYGWNCSSTFLSVAGSYSTLYDCQTPDGSGLPDTVSRSSAPGSRTYPCPPETIGCGSHDLDQIGYARNSGLLPDGSNFHGPPYGKRECDYCYPCREGHTTMSDTGVQTLGGETRCAFCKPGYGYKPNGCSAAEPCGLCGKCVIGTWSDKIIKHGEYCKSCGLHAKTAFTGSTSIKNCTCKTVQDSPGYAYWYKYSEDYANGYIDCRGPPYTCSYGQTCPTGIQCFRNYDLLGKYNKSSPVWTVNFGWLRSPLSDGEDGCLMCSEGKYKDTLGSGQCTTCPVGKTIITQRAGKTWEQMSSQHQSPYCINCAAGKYHAVHTDGICVNCPLYSTSPAGSSLMSQCTCNSGYEKVAIDALNFTCEPLSCTAGSTGPAGSCTQCAPGKYKAASGSAPCDDCVPGKYSAATGASTAATCLSCSAGSYAGTPGSFACSLCPSGKYSNATAASTSTTCQDCLAGKYSAATGASTAATCQNCAAGSYAATQASSACSLCPSSTYSAVTGVTTCQNCEQGKYSPAGSSSHTQCNLCAAGYGYIHDPNKGRQYCFPCLRGFYKPYADNSACLYCPCNLYGCSSTLNEGSISQADCMCAPNSVGINGQQGCSVCPAGKFKSGYGNGVCETTGRSCVNPCGQGNFKNNDVCTVCPANTYKYWGGDCEPCIPCWNGTYVGGAGTAPGECSPPECPTGKETIAASGQKYCLTCGVNQWSERGNSCQDCPVNSYSATGGTGLAGCICNEFYKQDNTGEITASSYFACRAAQCPAGTTGTSPACTLCTIGTYKSIEGTSACLPCPANTFSNVSRTVTCAQCPPFSGTNGGTGKTAQTDCVCTNTGPAGGPCEPVLCAAGWTGPAGSCVACLGGTYKNTVGSEACALCPLNSSSPSGSSALTACQCNAGFSGANGGTCSACVAGSYKATVGSVACTLCGANTYSTSNASISATSCLACPGNTTSVEGSSVCQCKSGYSGPDGGPCEACSVGFYKTTAGAGNCTRCPENAVSALASTTLASCKCDAGHSGPDGGQCTACAAGSYKPTVGSVACTLCGVNTYGTTLGAISNTSCVGCPGNSTSVRGSDKPELCFCKAGYEQTKEFDSCIECRPGFYDNITNRHECSICGGGLYSASWGASGPETCKECGPGTWSDIGSATCSLCPPNSNSSARSTSLTDCKCIPGFTGQDGQTCEACERGEYKASVGNASCTICSENSYSARGTDLYSELTDRGGTRCMCLFGYTGPDSGNCTACEEGKYKNVSGSTLCYNCARNSTSPAGSSQKSACVCNAGYEETISGSEENELNCTACARGKYKATISFKYLQILLNPCSSCPANFTTISGSAASGCECDVGYSNSSTNTTSQNWCGSCKIGTYKNSTGNISWAYGRSASDGCVVDDGCCQCPQNRTTLSVATVESVECLCMRGFGGSGCKVCSAGKYKENISMGECVSCPFGSTTVDMGSSAASHCVAARGHYGNLTVGFTACANGSYAPRTGMQQCIPCPPGATSPLGAVSDVLCVCELTGWTRSLANTSDLCSCREGFARNPVTRQCELCKANYSCAGGDLPAQPCPNASVSPSGSANTTDCVCMAGYSGVDGGPCVGCGKGEWKAVNGSSQCIKCVNNTMSVERSTSVKSCLCKPGYTGEDGGPCTACELGSYKEEEGAFVCRNCTANTTTLERGSSKYLNCLCNSGFELSSSSDNQNTTICAACAVGKYKQTPGLPQVCLSCPDYKTTLRVGSMVQSECVCVPGWFSAFNSSSCQMCAENSFKASTGNEPCTLCFPHAISPAGSNTSSACQCVQGFTGPNGGACAQCMPGQYKTVIGSSQCLQCVANSISPAGSTNATECVCNAGFVGQLGGPCSACPRDTYALKNTVSATGVCMPCPAYSESEPQSSSLTSCKCLPGYEGTAGGPCTPCGLGYYRGSNDATCRQCPRYTNTTSLIAQSAAECKGTPGYVTGVVKMPSVNITTTLPYSLEQFTDDVQAKIKKSIAASAQAVCECVVNEEDVTILDVKPISEETAVSSSASSSATRRLLQASGAQLQLIHSIEVDTIDDVEEILNSMTVSILNEELKAQGLNGSTYNISKVPNIEDIVYASPCPQNTYKNSLGNNSCSSCPPQSSAPSGSSSIDACKCEGNLMKNRQGFCDRECAAGFEARTSMDVGGQMVTACAPCLKSFYKASAGSQDCTRCPPNSFSLLYNQTSVTSCMCEQGYIWNSVSNLCDACPPGTSNNNYNESVCYLCNTTCPADVL